MLSTGVRPAALLRRSGLLLFFAALSSPLLSQTAPVSNPGAAGQLQSDPAAIQAMQNVMAQSGGTAAWTGMRSAEEAFSVLGTNETTPHVILLLDDWSQETTRYRRKVQGQSSPPSDHNGAPTYLATLGGRQVTVPEFDQARVLVGQLPAAAAEVMLRRSEYVLKISIVQKCKESDICVDVYRTHGPALPPIPDQQWKISQATGLPSTVRYQETTIGQVPGPVWKEVYFLQYAAEDGTVVPVSIGTNFRGQRQTWTFVSLEKNPGFDISQFDSEVAR